MENVLNFWLIFIVFIIESAEITKNSKLFFEIWSIFLVYPKFLITTSNLNKSYWKALRPYIYTRQEEGLIA